MTLLRRRYRPFLGLVHDGETERCLIDAVNLRPRVPSLVVKERFPVGDQELQVADLRRVDSRVVDLRDARMIERVPDATGG